VAEEDPMERTAINLADKLATFSAVS